MPRAARRDETTVGRPQFRPHMHTNTMSPVSFGPLSSDGSGNPDWLGHGGDWVTLASESVSAPGRVCHMHRVTVTAATVSVPVIRCPLPCSGHHRQVTVVPNPERDGRNRHVGECQFDHLPVLSQHRLGSLTRTPPIRVSPDPPFRAHATSCAAQAPKSPTSTFRDVQPDSEVEFGSLSHHDPND